MNPAALEPMTLVYHELRSPLGLVATAARAAAEECDDEDLRKRCEVIVSAADRMLRTAQQLFDLARGSEPPALAPFSPSDAVLAIAADHTALGREVDTVVTASARRTWTLGVREQFEALVQSLVSNALDHGDPLAPPLLQVAMDGDVVVLEVRNRVAGAPRHDGLGLGSYVVRGLAHRLGATLNETESGLEHVVRMRLPLGPVAETPALAQPCQAALPLAPAQG